MQEYDFSFLDDHGQNYRRDALYLALSVERDKKAAGYVKKVNTYMRNRHFILRKDEDTTSEIPPPTYKPIKKRVALRRAVLQTPNEAPKSIIEESEINSPPYPVIENLQGEFALNGWTI